MYNNLKDFTKNLIKTNKLRREIATKLIEEKQYCF